MRRAKSDWLLIVVGGLLGAFFEIAVGFFIAADGPGTLNPVAAVVSYQSPKQPGVDARLDVELFGHWHYSRTAPEASDFDSELIALRFGLWVIITGSGFGLG